MGSGGGKGGEKIDLISPAQASPRRALRDGRTAKHSPAESRARAHAVLLLSPRWGRYAGSRSVQRLKL